MVAPQSGGRLTIEVEGNLVQTLELVMPLLSIGRAPDNDLSLPHPRVSRRHAELGIGPEGPLLTDLNSSNGTFADGVQLPADQPHLLAHGAVFQIGPYVFTYYAPAALHPEAPDDVEPVPEEPPPAAVPGAAPGPAPVAAHDPLHVPVAPPAPPAPATPAWPASEAAQLPAPPARPPRPAFPAPVAAGQASTFMQHLPIIFQDHDFLSRFLLLFESIWEPLEQRQDHIDAYFDPATCPATFLPWLASWVDPSLQTHWPEPRIRMLLAEAMELYRWRGTRYGVARMIELCTGLAPQIVEDPAVPFVFRVLLEVPDSSGVDLRLVEGLVQAQKPAHAGYVLEVVAST